MAGTPNIDPVHLSELSIPQLEALAQQAQLAIKIKKCEEARQQGRAFDKLEDIHSSMTGHKHDFERVEPFGDTEVYRCKDVGCWLLVYKCSSCGFIPGLPVSRPYDNMAALAGTKGTIYSCNNCKEQVGRHVMEQS